MNADNLSLVDRATTTVEGWRAVRKALPPVLRRRLRMTPPAHAPTARNVLRSVLRARRALIAEPLVIDWPTITDVATVAGVDRTTILDWVSSTPSAKTRQGRVIVNGRSPAEVKLTPIDLRRVQKPSPRDIRYSRVQRQGDVTLSELAVLADSKGYQFPRRARGLTKFSTRLVHQLLIESGYNLAKGEKVPQDWFGRPESIVFWGKVLAEQAKRLKS